MIRFATGFESGAVPSLLTFTATPTVTAATDQVNSGTYALKMVSGATGWQMSGIGYTADAASDDVIIGFAARTNSLTVLQAIVAILWGTNNWLNFCIDTDGSMSVRRNTSFGTAGVVIGTSAAGVFTADAWHYIVVRAVPHDTTGIAEIWVNGVQVLNLTNVDTLVSAVTTQRSITFGRFGGGNTFSAWLDDILVADQTGTGIVAPFDPIRIEALNPTADVAAGMTGSDGNSVDNYLLLDDRPAAMADYVESAVSTTRDRFTLSDRAHTGGVLGVVAVAVASNPDGGAASLEIGIRSGASENISTAKGLGANPTHEYHIAEVDPASSIAFTTADVNGLEVIIEVA